MPKLNNRLAFLNTQLYYSALSALHTNEECGFLSITCFLDGLSAGEHADFLHRHAALAYRLYKKQEQPGKVPKMSSQNILIAPGGGFQLGS